MKMLGRLGLRLAGALVALIGVAAVAVGLPASASSVTGSSRVYLPTRLGADRRGRGGRLRAPRATRRPQTPPRPPQRPQPEPQEKAQPNVHVTVPSSLLPPLEAPAPGLDPAVPSPSPVSSFLAAADTDVVIPPDTNGAVGLDKVMATLNNNYVIRRKSDGRPEHGLDGGFLGCDRGIRSLRPQDPLRPVQQPLARLRGRLAAGVGCLVRPSWDLRHERPAEGHGTSTDRRGRNADHGHVMGRLPDRRLQQGPRWRSA